MSRGWITYDTFAPVIPWSQHSIERNGVPFALAALDKEVRRLETACKANRSEDMSYPKWERDSFARLEANWQKEVLFLLNYRKELANLVSISAKPKTTLLVGYNKLKTTPAPAKKSIKFPPTKIVNKKFKGFPPTKIVESYGSPSAIAARRAAAQAKLANKKAYALAAGARKEAAKAKLLAAQVNAWHKRTFPSAYKNKK